MKDTHDADRAAPARAAEPRPGPAAAAPPDAAPDTAPDRSPDPSALSRIAALGARIGFDVVEVGGFLDTLDAEARDQLVRLSEVRTAADGMVGTTEEMRGQIAGIAAASEAALGLVVRSVDDMRAAGERARAVAQWVRALSERMVAIETTVKDVRASNAQITAIARQVNILAINAKIEAARAGDAGRGFAVVADSVNALSRQTERAAATITEGTESLAGQLGALRSEAGDMAGQAGEVLGDAARTDGALGEIAESVRSTAGGAEDVSRGAEAVGTAIARFRPAFDGIAQEVGRMAGQMGDVRARVHSLVDRSEEMVQASVEAGGEATDARFIARVKGIAADIGRVFEQGIDSGRISATDLFSRDYTPIRGTNPEQVMAPCTRFTDAVLPDIQEAALGFDPGIVFCAAVNVDGYLPTHNLKFAQPQGDDPVWNAANCRNRRIFDDRVGLKAGRNTQPFLLQIYRRDMGGGNFVLMKDLSAPILVQGRHWGGVRLAYRV